MPKIPCNFRLSEKTVAALKRRAKEGGCSQAEIIEGWAEEIAYGRPGKPGTLNRIIETPAGRITVMNGVGTVKCDEPSSRITNRDNVGPITKPSGAIV